MLEIGAIIMLDLKSLPPSRIEHFEALRQLPIGRRIQYALWFNGLTIITFAGLCAISIVVLLPIIQSAIPRRWSFGDYVLVTISIICTFFIAIGMTGGELPERITPKDTLRHIILRSGRQGFITGFFVGVGFGMMWAVAVRVGLLYAQLNTIYGQAVFLEDLILYGGLLGLFIAPMFGLFRICTSGLSYGLLALMKGE
ncbi:MAG: hypothetical protein CUN52_13610 [Phototrophicales bacterium]|nr:MAG: hypothetical protein CUN52_13610 [Phototrophicales bacterium]